jgi:hypothetical protein
MPDKHDNLPRYKSTKGLLLAQLIGSTPPFGVQERNARCQSGGDAMTIIDDLFEESDERLLEQVGEALLKDTKRVLPPTLEAKINAAQRWLAEKKELLCRIICNNADIKLLLAEGKYGKELALLVIDVLIHHAVAIVPVPPAAAGMLFCRYSYYKLCAGHP